VAPTDGRALSILISLVVGVPLGVAVGVLVFWLLSR
jgi:NhaP-type Na+/H+ or K+/H+ antiporter